MDGQFYLNVDNQKVYIAEILTTFSLGQNMYAVFSIEEGDFINIQTARLNNDGTLVAILDEREKREVFEVVKKMIVGE